MLSWVWEETTGKQNRREKKEMKEELQVLCKDFFYRGQHYYIVFNGKYVMSVKHELVGSDGHPVKELH